MEEPILLDNTAPKKKQTCIECDNPIIVKGYPNPLCEACREKFIKYPIPKWIKLFAAGIVVLLLFSLSKLPKNILTAMHLEKGKTAIAEKKYITAQLELEKADASLPGNQETESYLLLAAYHNQDLATLFKMFESLKSKTFEDQELFSKVESKIDQAQYFFPDDNFNALVNKNDSNYNNIPIDSLKAFTVKYPDNIYALYYYAGILSNKEDYPNCDSVLRQILDLNASFSPALELMSSVKRQENQFDSSINYCNKILDINKESAFAIASKARTFLKQKKDAEALKLALESVSLDANNPYSTGSLLLAYHFNNKQNEKQSLLKKIAAVQDTSYIASMQYVKDVISGKEIFRN